MKRSLVQMLMLPISLVVIVSLGGGILEAQENLEARLHGEYAFTFARTCVQGVVPLSGGVFGSGPNFLLQSGTSPSHTTAAAQGVVHYNGDGTGSYSHFLLQLNSAPVVSTFASPLTQGNFACDLTYSVNPDGSFSQSLSNCSGTLSAGAVGLPGRAFTISGIQNDGQIAQGGRTLLWFSTATNVESVTIPDVSGQVSFPPSHRMCNRTGTAVNIGMP